MGDEANSARGPGIGSAEMELLEFVSDRGGATVREAADHFARTKGYVRTTVLQMMERLRHKGYLRRDRDVGSFRYSAVDAKESVEQRMVERFVGESLRGSVSPLVTFLSDAQNLSDDEVDRLRKLIVELDGKRKDKQND
jgi:predicted transcriptional regulator